MKKTIFLFIFLNFVSAAYTAPLKKYTVRNAIVRQAVCNDGSPAIYYVREGSGEAGKNWVIFLTGGGFCFSVNSCNERKNKSPKLMTSVGYPSSLNGEGIFSTSQSINSDFYNTTQVVIPYCSSDLWSGNREGSSSTGGHEFRGRRIFRAVIADLKNRRAGRNLTSANRILLSGTSAGGIGVMIHLDWLASKFRGVDVRGINDAGWTPDPESVPILGTAINRSFDRAIRLWNGKPDSSCAQAHRNSKYRCYTSGVYPYLNFPLMVQMSQFDTVFLGAIGVQHPFDVREKVYAELFAAAVRQSLRSVPAAFSPRTPTHGLLHTSKFGELKVDGFSLNQILGNWFFSKSGPVKIVDDP